jgi:hypothetical protein
MIPFELGLYIYSQMDQYLKQGKAPIDAFSDAVIDAGAKYVGLIAEDVSKAIFQGLKQLFKDIFRLW